MPAKLPKAILSLLIILIIFAFFLIFRSFVLKQVPIISNPVDFAVNFVPVGNTNVNLKLRCKFFAILSCKGSNEYLASSYFPYVGLKYKYIERTSIFHWKILLSDPIWGVFWFQTEDSSGLVKLYFGPYRYY